MEGTARRGLTQALRLANLVISQQRWLANQAVPVVNIGYRLLPGTLLHSLWVAESQRHPTARQKQLAVVHKKKKIHNDTEFSQICFFLFFHVVSVIGDVCW